MKRIGLLIAFIFLLIPAFIQAQEVNVEELKKDIEYLASDELEGRETGTKGEELAAAYIAKRFEEVGLTPKGDKGKWFQSFSRKPQANPHSSHPVDTSKAITGKNVIGYLDNGANKTIVIGAHYDHLGYGGEGSLHAKGKAIHNGADDNASGVAAIIQIVNQLKIINAKGNNYLFIAFSGEEKGLWGSNYFTKNPTIDLKTVNYMINLDMVGRMKDGKMAINGTGTSAAWGAILDNVANDPKIKRSESGMGPSDHTSFYLKDIPVLHFFTGQHEDYHKPSDDIEKLNYDGIVRIINIITRLIDELDGEEKLFFIKTKDDDMGTSPRFTVTLGVMPDYLFDGKGMRIDGIREDKPAQKAGLLVGDVVVKMGDVDVVDMQSYMEALSKFKEGDKTKVTVDRKGKLKTVSVQF